MTQEAKLDVEDAIQTETIATAKRDAKPDTPSRGGSRLVVLTRG
jgi:hypothetical protein